MKQFLILITLIPCLLNGQDCNGRYDTVELFQKIDTFTYQYGENMLYEDTVKLYLTLYRPNKDSVKNRSCVIFCHGGNTASTTFVPGRFVSGNRKSFELNKMAYYLAKRGHVVATIDYRLDKYDSIKTDKQAFQALIRGVQDANGAIRFLKSKWDTFQLDTTRFFLGGISNGGVIALTQGYSSFNDFDSIHKEWIQETGGLVGTTNLIDKDMFIKAYFSFSGGVLDTAHIQGADYPLYMNHQNFDTVIPYYNGYYNVGNGGFKVNGAGDIKYRIDSVGGQYTIDSFYGLYHPSLAYIWNQEYSFARLNRFFWEQLECFRVSISSVSRDNEISFTPNPAKDHIHIESYKRKISVQISDFIGRTVFNYAGTAKELNISSIPPGVYLLNINEKIFRFVKE